MQKFKKIFSDYLLTNNANFENLVSLLASLPGAQIENATKFTPFKYHGGLWGDEPYKVSWVGQENRTINASKVGHGVVTALNEISEFAGLQARFAKFEIDQQTDEFGYMVDTVKVKGLLTPHRLFMHELQAALDAKLGREPKQEPTISSHLELSYSR